MTAIMRNVVGLHVNIGLVGRLCFTSHRQRGHLETAPPFTMFTVPCKGREARFLQTKHTQKITVLIFVHTR